MSLSFFVRADEIPPFNGVVAASAGEPVQLAGAGFTGDAWPKGLYAKLGDVAKQVVVYELLPADTRAIAVGFADGHAEVLPADQLKARLAELKLPDMKTLP